MKGTEKITVLREIRDLFRGRGVETEIVDGSVCLSRRVFDPSVQRPVLEVSAACSMKYRYQRFWLRCVQKIDEGERVLKYSVQLNDWRDIPIVEEGYTPERGAHRSEFKEGKKRKGVHLPTSGKLDEIVGRFMAIMEQSWGDSEPA